MFQIKPFLFLSVLFCTAVNYAQFTDVINSNRPGMSMGAFSVGKTVIQGELGLATFRQNHNETFYNAEGLTSTLQVRYGAFFEQLELILNADYQNEVYKDTYNATSMRNAGFKQVSLGAKFLVYDPAKNYKEKKPNLYSYNANHKFSWRQFIPAVGVYGGFNLDMSSGKFDRPTYPIENKLSPTIGILTQNQFGKFAWVMNVMADKLATQRESINYVLTLTRGFNDRWSGLFEHQGYVSNFYSDAIFRVGVCWLAAENIQVDASIASSIKDTPSYLTGGIGVSWRFDANYEEIKLRVPEEKESKADKKKKDKKEKAKKRLDAIENGTDPDKVK